MEKNHQHDCCGHSHEGSTESIFVSEGDVPRNGKSTTFKVRGMDCADEVAAIQQSLKKDGIYKIQANLMSSTVQVWHEETFSGDLLKKLINASGVKVVEGDGSQKAISTSRIWLVVISGVFCAAAFVGQLLGVEQKIVLALLALISVVAGGVLIFPKALRAIRKFRLDMNVLMTVAVVGAFYLQDYVEGATVVFLFALSELLEAFSVVRARKAIQEVLNLSPKLALLKQADGSNREVSVEDLNTNDVVIVRAGDIFPTDGFISTGATDVNQAPLTGESTPVKKNEGDVVYGGTVNLTGVVEIKVGTAFKDSKVSQIIRMVEEAQKSKAPSQKFVDQFASIYTPAVFVLAILVGVLPPLIMGAGWDEWIYKALVLLVIACPCALVISTPVSIVSGLTAMARRGVLIKGGVFLETLGKLKALAVDKTGTITEGVPQVVSLKLWGNKPEAEVIKVAASIEGLSTHPLAQAVVRYASEKGITLEGVSSTQNVHGKGIYASLAGHEYFLGNHKFTHEIKVCSPALESYLESLEEQALSVIVLGHKPHADCEGEVLGVFGVGDKVRSNAKNAVEQIHAAGCKTVVMLSGDNKKTVEAISRQVGIDESYGELLPDGKVAHIKELVSKHKYVGMIGDGINDAPALAQASIGIAMGAVGTDAAIETADVALMKDDLLQVATAIRLGRRSLGIIRFNIIFALLLKAIFLGLALFGISSMWMAIAADTGATLIVVFNALRLLKID
ncbi:heavy metal translocating P-type ATPase [Bdellovibrio sp.]|uniref:heavy metal translocating P-type ATPase n=1 Tax=Bdellovibrio sp. TaxID=28201 RepID=UPI0039E269B1